MEPLLIDVPERVVTERLVLRAPRPGDGAALNAALMASLDELRPWMPWAQTAPTVEDSELMVRRQAAKFRLREDLVFQIWEHDGAGHEATFIGSSGLHRMDWAVPRFEIGYWVRTGYRKKGLITEAVIALSRMAFDQLNAQRVELRIDPRNEPSWRVAERAGFTLEGTLRNNQRTPDGRVRDTRVYTRVRGVEEPALPGDPTPAR